MKKLKPQQIPLTELPFDCIFEISNYFEKPVEAINLMKSCSMYNAYFNSPGFRGCRNIKFFIRARYFTFKLPNPDKMYTFVSYIEFVDEHQRSHEYQNLVLEMSPKKALQLSLKSFLQLRQLSIVGWIWGENREFESYFVEALESSPSLVYLEMKNTELFITEKFPKMEFLEEITVRSLYIRVACCGDLLPRVKKFTVEGEIFDSVANVRFKSLKSLSLNSCRVSNFGAEFNLEQNFLQACCSIEVLDILTPLSFVDANNFPNLTDITIHIEFLVRQSIVNLNKMRNLHSLRIVINPKNMFKRDISKLILSELFHSDIISQMKIIDFDFTSAGQRWTGNIEQKNEQLNHNLKYISALLSQFCSKSTRVRFCCNEYIKIGEERDSSGIIRCENCSKCCNCSKKIPATVQIFPGVILNHCEVCKRRFCENCKEMIDYDCAGVIRCITCQSREKCCICNISEIHMSDCTICKRKYCDCNGCCTSCGGWCEHCDENFFDCITCFEKFAKRNCELCSYIGCGNCVVKCEKCVRTVCRLEWRTDDCVGWCQADGCNEIMSINKYCKDCFPKCEICQMMICIKCTNVCEKCDKRCCADRCIPDEKICIECNETN